ncbi:hypothetical protein EAVNVH72_03475 [Elizabethkingia anophelis]|uniref:hypothetical protein n=1 Tax=Elizabethkingia anophelis TaxID=1117645 RepID=UPI0020B7653A|nr:hypothetical protein [Elizabethkingia anophelis]UTG65245.1 hypothetical protein J2O02_01465 [Elizabethkingia anophelis]CAH1152262.1 hypothetical protein EAVNVH72_02341 [Elizabethkingia anophelis]CAI9686744.1 hypothetical protein EAVNVH72_03475 [Elizabethkingia anophelis]
MKITDLNGCEIEITDLKEAIKIAKRNTGYSHEDKSFSEFDKRQKAYWTDIYEKLTAIKKQVTTH